MAATPQQISTAHLFGDETSRCLRAAFVTQASRVVPAAHFLSTDAMVGCRGAVRSHLAGGFSCKVAISRGEIGCYLPLVRLNIPYFLDILYSI